MRHQRQVFQLISDMGWMRTTRNRWLYCGSQFFFL